MCKRGLAAYMHWPLPELYLVAGPYRVSFYALAFCSACLLFRSEGLGNSISGRPGFPGAGRGDVLFPCKINCTKLVFLFSRLIWLDTEHSRRTFLAWQAGVTVLQHLPAKSRCYFSPWLTLHTTSRTACGQRGACTRSAAPERHLRGMRGASWMCAGLS